MSSNEPSTSRIAAVDSEDRLEELEISYAPHEELAQDFEILYEINGGQEHLIYEHLHYPVAHQELVYDQSDFLNAQQEFVIPPYQPPQLHYDDILELRPAPGAIRRSQRRAPVLNPRPFLTYGALCAMAIYNSPSGFVTSNDVYQFILHHFPHFRDLQPHWRNTVRNALSKRKQYFQSIGYDKASKGSRYALVDGITLEACFNADCWEFMKEKDWRTFDYYKYILQGQDDFLWILKAEQAREQEAKVFVKRERID